MITKRDIIIVAAGLLLCGASVLHSQQTVGKTGIQVLQAIKTSNADMIEKQKKTLETLDDMEKTSQQIKILGKRG